MSDWTDILARIRSGLAANLRAIDGVQVTDRIIGNPTLPTVWVMPGPTTFDVTFARGVDRVMFTVQAVTGTVTDEGAQAMLDELLSPEGDRSVKQAIETDTTLGGAVHDLRVTAATGYQRSVIMGKSDPVLTCDWTVEVLV